MQSIVANSMSFGLNLSNNFGSNELQNKNNQELKKDWLKKHYDDQYTRDKQVNNSAVGIMGITGLLCLLGHFIMKEQKYKSELLFAGLGLGAGSLVSYIFKPQKEKYDSQVQIELNKEVVDENSGNK